MKRFLVFLTLVALPFTAKAQSLDFFVANADYEEVGETIKVPVVINYLPQTLRSFQFQIKWDPDVLKFVYNFQQDYNLDNWYQYMYVGESDILYKAESPVGVPSEPAYMLIYGFEAVTEEWVSTKITLHNVQGTATGAGLLATQAYPGTVTNVMKVGIETTETVEQGFEIYPNPSQDYIRINTSLVDFDVTVYDIQGKEVIRESNTYEINIEHLPIGQYIVQFREGDSLYSLLHTKF